MDLEFDIDHEYDIDIEKISKEIYTIEYCIFCLLFLFIFVLPKFAIYEILEKDQILVGQKY